MWLLNPCSKSDRIAEQKPLILMKLQIRYESHIWAILRNLCNYISFYRLFDSNYSSKAL